MSGSRTTNGSMIDIIPYDIESGNDFRPSTKSTSYDGDGSAVMPKTEELAAIQESARDETASPAATVVKYNKNHTNWSLALLICLFGVIVSTSFVVVSMNSAFREEDQQFKSVAATLVQEIGNSWNEYENAGLWIHQACRKRDISRTEFRELYEHLTSGGLAFQAVEFIPNVTEAERPVLEAEAQGWYEKNDLQIGYQGFRGLEPMDPNDPKPSQLTVQNRSRQQFYFPVHYVEPIEGNEAAVGFDVYSSESRRTAIDRALTMWEPTVTSRLVQETSPTAYSVQLMHPGIRLSTQPNLVQARDVSSVVIRINGVLERATAAAAISESLAVYIYDTTTEAQVEFLGGASLQSSNGYRQVQFLSEIELDVLRSSNRRQHEEIDKVASSTWTIVIVANEGSFEPVLFYIILGGVLIMSGFTCLAGWVCFTIKRQEKNARIATQADAEKAALVVNSAQKAARNERELNDFIAHEVRNPLASAMSACSFVMSAVNDETKPFAETRGIVNEDLTIIDSALQFINDLLRNMLDMHRAKSNQLNIDLAPVDIMQDVFKPVDAMLYRRGSDVEIQLVCPPNLIILSDRLRLKQIVLNLGRNALKFVEKGFIRLTAAAMDDGTISLLIEDSGPGIPPEKRQQMFAKFQESLDSLNQGTGIGLSLCLNLVELMGGTIHLDESYDSGVPGRPGAGIVVHLKTPPLNLEQWGLMQPQSLMMDSAAGGHSGRSQHDSAVLTEEEEELPEHLSVLFVDDDMVLRKLFARSIRKLCPGWTVQEASNGESALQLVKDDANHFQLIFVDQYMASVEKQLLGTETVRALRVAGCEARICGLSANDVQNAFEDVGADAFMFKPFPTKAAAMKAKLLSILDGYCYPGSSGADQPDAGIGLLLPPSAVDETETSHYPPSDTSNNDTTLGYMQAQQCLAIAASGVEQYNIGHQHTACWMTSPAATSLRLDLKIPKEKKKKQQQRALSTSTSKNSLISL